MTMTIDNNQQHQLTANHQNKKNKCFIYAGFQITFNHFVYLSLYLLLVHYTQLKYNYHLNNLKHICQSSIRILISFIFLR